MDAAQVVHRTDRKAHRGSGRERRIGHQARAGDADQGRYQMPAEYRPGLRERAVRHGEHQHRGGPDRKNQQRRRRLAAKGMAGEIDRQHPDQAAERRYQPFTMADRTQFDTQDFLPRRWRRRILLGHFGFLEKLALRRFPTCKTRVEPIE
jgi:hypothetical protein